MKMQNRKASMTCLAVTVTVLAAPVAADEPSAEQASQAAQELAQLQRNVHEMRRIFENDRAQRKALRRANSGPLIIDSRDAPGIGTMRAELSQSLDRLASRCFGNEIDADGGNVILICGNNAGTAESSNVTNSAYTTVVVPPSPSDESDDGEMPDNGDSADDAANDQVQP
jgi:hypothetical protein